MTNINFRRFTIEKWKILKRTKIYYSFILAYCFFITFLPFSFSSQKTIKVQKSVGTCYITGDISPNQAKVKALNDAKINALLNSGIGENIYSYKTLYKQQENKNFEQVFTSQFQSELNGNIIDYEIKSERIYCKNELEIIYEIIIDANIIKYKSEFDNKFQVNIENLKATFNVGDDFSFQFKSTVDCYLTIFDLLDTTAALVYPQNESSKKNIKNSEIKFPYERNFTVELSPGNVVTSEPHRLLLVFTKEEYPYILHDANYFASYEKVIGWVNSIEPSQKNIQYYGFQILPK